MLLEGASIVCFANDWDSDPLSKKHIMRILAKKNRVLWINSIGLRRPTASSGDLRRMAAKLRRGLSGLRRGVEVEPNLFVADPLVVPLPGIGPFDRLNGAILAGWIRHLCHRYGIVRPILWTFLPNVTQLVGRLGEQMLIYHCVDENSAFLGAPRAALLRMERDLVRRAHLVFTSSQQLCEERIPLNPNTHFIPHGVDVAHFGRALDPTTDVPNDLRGLPRPVVGFFGLISDDWVDLSLLRAVAVARPAWSLVLIGKTTMDLRPIQDLPNVHLLGRKPYSALPAYCRGFDVGIIPFRRSELTVRANPLKLREYLAAGLPVVSTPLPEVARHGSLVRLADGPEAFIAEIEAATNERSDAMVRRRVEAMRREAWDVRVAEMSEYIAARPGPTRPQPVGRWR